MNKSMKKIVSLVLSVALVFALAVPAFAAIGTHTAEVKGIEATLGTAAASPEAALAGTPGAVSITAEDLAGEGVTALTVTDDADADTSEDVVKVFYFPAGTEVTAAELANVDEITNEAVAADSTVVFEVTDGTEAPIYYAVVVSEDEEEEEEPDKGYVSDPDEPGTITVPGDVGAIDDDIYSMTVPTDEDLSFQLDPQGIYYGEAGDLLSELDGGKIIPLAAGKIVNHSTYAVNMSLEFTAASTSATDTDDTKFLDFDEDAETTIENVNTGTDNNVLLLAVPSTTNVINNDAFDADNVFAASANGFVVTDEMTTLDFYFAGAEHKLNADKTEFVEVEDAAYGTALQIAGYVNPNASWAKYVDPDEADPDVNADTTIKLDIRYNPTRAGAAPAADAYVEGVANLLKTSTANAAVPTGEEEPDPENDVKFDAAGTEEFSIAEADYLEDGVVVYLSQKPESVTSLMNATFAVSADTGYSYDKTTGLLTIVNGFSARNTVLPLKITADGVVYTLNLTITKA